MSKDKWWKNPVLREWVESFVIAFILAMFIRTFFIQAFKIPSGSMRMTLVEGDRLMVNKLRYGPKIPFTSKRLPGFNDIKRGDIVVFVYPQDPKKDFIKRLIAFEGETVSIQNGDVYIDGRLIEDPVIKNIKYFNAGKLRSFRSEIEVPKGHMFFLGDNSEFSHDSRFWGFVPEENIVGRAEFIYWPFNRIKMIR